MLGRDEQILEMATPPRRRGRPATVERDDLIRVALERGPDRLNLREIAAQLDVPRSTIYNHVRNPADLGRLVLSSLLSPISWLVPPGGWRERLESFARQERAALLAAGEWLRFLDNLQIRQDSTDLAEEVVVSLVEAGFSVNEAGHALSLVHGIVLESIRFEQQEIRPDSVEHHFLATRAWPLLASTAEAVDKDWADEQFEFALSRTIAGIGALGPDKSPWPTCS